MAETYKSAVLASVHETASDLHDANLLDKKTMSRFDSLCLAPVEQISPEGIRALRRRNRLSQAVFARYLNVSRSSVSQWERGEKSPSSTALKLLSILDRKGLDALS